MSKKGREKHSKGARCLQLKRNNQDEKLLQRPGSCESHFMSDKIQSSLILKETSEFSATRKLIEVTHIRSESKDSL